MTTLEQKQSKEIDRLDSEVDRLRDEVKELKLKIKKLNKAKATSKSNGFKTIRDLFFALKNEVYEQAKRREQQFNSLIDINSILINPNADRNKIYYILEQPISKIAFSQRAINCMQANSYFFIRDIILYGKQPLAMIRNTGSKTVEEIEYKLKELGLKLPDKCPSRKLFDELRELNHLKYLLKNNW